MLKEQVGLAITKAAANKEFKEKYKLLDNENNQLKQELSKLSAQTNAKEKEYIELQKQLLEKDEEISNFANAKKTLLEKLQSIQEEVQKSKSSDNQIEVYRLKIKELEAVHVKEMEEIKESHELELQELVEKLEEEQVVEFNLLDHELDKLRDEKQDLLAELETVKQENDILQHASDEAATDVLDDEKFDRIYKDYQLIKEQLGNIEKLYKEEMGRRQSLQVSCSWGSQYFLLCSKYFSVAGPGQGAGSPRGTGGRSGQHRLLP